MPTAAADVEAINQVLLNHWGFKQTEILRLIDKSRLDVEDTI